jgi:hypothetical protein
MKDCWHKSALIGELRTRISLSVKSILRADLCFERIQDTFQAVDSSAGSRPFSSYLPAVEMAPNEKLRESVNAW